MITFIVDGKPQGKARPRFMRNGHTYTPKETTEYEKKVAEAYREVTDYNFGDVPVTITIHAFFEIPKSWAKKRQRETIAYDLKPTVKPDVDNIAKIIIDGLNGVAYNDDKQVTSVKVYKHYSGNEPSVRVMISEDK